MPGQGREDNFTIYLTDTGPENTNLIILIQDRAKCWAGVNILMMLLFPQNAVYFLTS